MLMQGSGSFKTDARLGLKYNQENGCFANVWEGNRLALVDAFLDFPGQMVGIGSVLVQDKPPLRLRVVAFEFAPPFRVYVVKCTKWSWLWVTWYQLMVAVGGPRMRALSIRLKRLFGKAICGS